MRGSDTWMAGLGRLVRWAGLAALVAGLLGCASGPKQVWHAFTFNGWYDGWAQSARLIAYSYGDQYHMVREAAQDGQYLGSQSGVNGPMPVGDFLYVKWLVKATGEVKEQRVDLSDRLPKDMKDHELTFVIEERQLYVFVVTPRRKKFYGEPPVLRTWRSNFAHAYEIFPDLNKP